MQKGEAKNIQTAAFNARKHVILFGRYQNIAFLCISTVQHS